MKVKFITQGLNVIDKELHESNIKAHRQIYWNDASDFPKELKKQLRKNINYEGTFTRTGWGTSDVWDKEQVNTFDNDSSSKVIFTRVREEDREGVWILLAETYYNDFRKGKVRKMKEKQRVNLMKEGDEMYAIRLTNPVLQSEDWGSTYICDCEVGDMDSWRYGPR